MPLLLEKIVRCGTETVMSADCKVVSNNMILLL